MICCMVKELHCLDMCGSERVYIHDVCINMGVYTVGPNSVDVDSQQAEVGGCHLYPAVFVA